MRSLICASLIAVTLQAQEEGRGRRGANVPVPAPSGDPTLLRIEGFVRDSLTGEPLPGAYVRVKGNLAGAVSGLDGAFRLQISGVSLPATIEVSFVGYETREFVLRDVAPLDLRLREGSLKLQEVVISTSRVPETILEAPVTISHVGQRELRLNAGANLIQQLSTLKNVDVNYQSITFPIISIRGFGGPESARLVQRVDGIDMLAPVFGLPMGILAVPSDIDVESVELMAGPASALYGPNAVNGMIDIYTRSARRHPGLYSTLKTGLNHINSDTTPQPYLNFSLRYAQTLGDRFSYKFVAEYLQAMDWMAVDYRDRGSYGGAEGAYAIPGPQNPGYEGLNVYGDEIRIGPIDPVALGLPVREKFHLGRTGYRDRDIVDPSIRLQKYSAGLQYFLTERVELSWRSFLVNGNTAFQAGSRFALRNITFHQHKLELRTPELLARIYGSWENSGNTYSAALAGIFLNERLKPSPDWFLGYLEGLIVFNTHEAARVYVDTARQHFIVPGTFRPRPQPGTPEFREALKEVTENYYVRQYGAGIYDRSSFYHADFQYDISKYTRKIVDILIGGNFRTYRVNSRGSLFIDYEGPFLVHEYAGFVQANRWLWDRRLRVLGSLRYDKSQYFKGRLTPRVATLLAIGPERQHSVRLSYQTGFRLPSLQEQFIGFGFNDITLGGTSKARGTFGLDRWMFEHGVVEAYRSAAAGISDSATLAMKAQQYLKPLPTDFLRPEYVQSYEVGARVLILKGLYLDVEYARTYYNDFIIFKRVLSSKATFESSTNRLVGLSNIDPNTYEGLVNLRDGNYQTYFTAYNVSERVYADYGSAAIEYAITPKILWTLSYSYAALNIPINRSPIGVPDFNTPPHKVVSSLYFSNLGRWGAGLNYRWIDAVEFGGIIKEWVPATQWVDAQVSYTIPRYRIQLRLGAQNLLNIRYVQIPGGPRIGGLYYFQITYDPTLSKR